MILSNVDIEMEMAAGRIRFESVSGEPMDVRVSQASVDLRLGEYVLVQKCDGKFSSMYLDDESAIRSGDFWLGFTQEVVHVPNNIVAIFNGRSSGGRLGLCVHATAGYIDPGFVGQITAELSVVGKHPINLSPGMRFAQISFQYTKSPCSIPYNEYGRYNDSGPQLGPVTSKGLK